MLELVRVGLGGLFPLICAYSLGAAVSRRLRLPEIMRFGVGAVLLSQLLFLLLIAGWVNVWTVALLGACALAAGLRRLSWPRIGRDRMVWLLLAPYGVLYLVHALAPEIQPDGYTYHLGLVSEWARTGGFGDRVGFYEMLPQGLETLFTMAYLLGGPSAAKLVHFAFLAGAGPLLAATARRLGLDGVPAAILYLTAPVAGVCGTSAYNDAALAFFALATFFLLVAWRQDGGDLLAVAAGAMAGFCYAVKLTGIVAVPAALGYLLLRGRRAALLAAVAVVFVAAPWMLRTALMSGNPLAPLFNRYFPNPHFHISTEETLTRYLRNYDLSAAEMPLELTVGGAALGGLVGPVFLLVPLGLLALRRRAGRAVWAAAGIAAIPWLLNAGTRFLMPALVFVSLAMAIALRRRWILALALAQGILCWPQVLDFYEAPGAWRLRGFPWKAALRVESEAEYLRRELPEYRIAELLGAHTRAGDQTLALAAAPAAYVQATLLAPWQSAAADRAADALQLASVLDRGVFYELRARWPPVPLSGLRFLQAAAGGEPWSIQEIQLRRGGEPILASRTWEISAEPNVWETPLALDGNLISRWQTWQERRPGMFFQLDFPAPQQLEGATLICYGPEKGARVAVWGRAPGADWRLLTDAAERHERIPLNLRRSATRVLKREGFSYILAPVGNEGYGLIGRELVDHPGDWGLEELGNARNVYLLKIR